MSFILCFKRQDVVNDEEGRHQELHVLLTIPRTHRADRAEEEAVVLHAQAGRGIAAQRNGRNG